MNPFCFCKTQYLQFATRVFGHSAISPFLGGLPASEMGGKSESYAAFCIQSYHLSIFAHPPLGQYRTGCDFGGG